MKAGLDVEKLIATISKARRSPGRWRTATRPWSPAIRFRLRGRLDAQGLGICSPRRTATARICRHLADRPVLFGSADDGRPALGYVEPNGAAAALDAIRTVNQSIDRLDLGLLGELNGRGESSLTNLRTHRRSSAPARRRASPVSPAAPRSAAPAPSHRAACRRSRAAFFAGTDNPTQKRNSAFGYRLRRSRHVGQQRNPLERAHARIESLPLPSAEAAAASGMK